MVVPTAPETITSSSWKGSDFPLNSPHYARPLISWTPAIDFMDPMHLFLGPQPLVSWTQTIAFLGPNQWPPVPHLGNTQTDPSYVSDIPCPSANTENSNANPATAMVPQHLAIALPLR